jgi:nodulation protein E
MADTAIRSDFTRPRLVVTGMGVVSALGNDVPSFGASLFDGRAGIGPITLFDNGDMAARVAAEVKGFDPADHFSSADVGLIDRFSQFALVAARQAVAAAGLTAGGLAGERRGLFHGTGIGGQGTQDATYRRLYGEGKRKLNPTTVPKLIPSAATSLLTIEFGITGPALTTATACSASGHAIANAVLMLRAGMIDMALAGGSEALLTPGTVRAWEALRVLAPDTCRPFSATRKGTVLGEGAAMVILETLDHARARGAPILAEVIGIGLASDAHHPVQPDRAGIVRTIRAALADAKIAPEAVDYINAHGTATKQNDIQESGAIAEVFGDHRPAVSSTKSMHGHTLGASSAMELVATIQALHAQCAPPTANFEEADPECDLDLVANQARPMAIDVALSHSFAFGGLNVVLALKRADGP